MASKPDKNRYAWMAAGLLLLAAVFAAYLRPAFIVSLSSQLLAWCT